MKLSYTLIIAGMLSFILSLIFFKYFNLYLNFVSLFLSVISIIIGIIWERDNRRLGQLSLDENRLQHAQIVRAIESQNEDRAKKLEATNSKLRQLMSKVSMELQKEHISKKELLKRIDKPIYALIFNKTEEMSLTRSILKPLRDKILPALGFKHIKGSRGMYILPPSMIPYFKDKNDIENWVKKNIIQEIPTGYRYIFSFISLIDLRYTLSIKNDSLTKKYDTLIDSIDAGELLTFSEGLTYLQRKKKLSLKDLIEIPNLFFLSDNTSIGFKDKEIMKEKNEEMINAIQNKVNKEVNTREFIDIDSNLIYNLLKSYITISFEDVDVIKSNAKFWLDLFNNKHLIDSY